MFCLAQKGSLGHFSCNSTTGTKICYSDWYGDNCTTYCLTGNHSSLYYSCSINGKIICNQFWYGENCSVLCKESDSILGHFTCNVTSGKKICLPGWRGTNCTLKEKSSSWNIVGRSSSQSASSSLVVLLGYSSPTLFPLEPGTISSSFNLQQVTTTYIIRNSFFSINNPVSSFVKPTRHYFISSSRASLPQHLSSLIQSTCCRVISTELEQSWPTNQSLESILPTKSIQGIDSSFPIIPPDTTMLPTISEVSPSFTSHLTKSEIFLLPSPTPSLPFVSPFISSHINPSTATRVFKSDQLISSVKLVKISTSAVNLIPSSSSTVPTPQVS